MKMRPDISIWVGDHRNYGPVEAAIVVVQRSVAEKIRDHLGTGTPLEEYLSQEEQDELLFALIFACGKEEAA